MKATTKDDVIIRPAPRLVRVEVLEETRTNQNTVEECTYGIVDKNEMTKLSVSTELVDLSQKLITRGFFELAEEARIVGMRQTPSVCMNEVIPQITEITKPRCNFISWKIEKDIEQSVESLCDVTMEVPTVRFDVGQLMQWPDMNSAVSARNGNRTRTPSPCYQLDDISSASSIGETSMNDYKLTLPTESTHSITPVGSIVFSSDDDVPLSSGQEDRRKVRRREVGQIDRPGPNEVPEYVPNPREEPVDIPIYKPTPRDRPVDGPIIGVRPADDRMYDPMLGEWPVDDRIFEPKTQLRPVGGQTLRESPVDTLVYKPTPRERPGGEKPYGPRPRERLVEVPTVRDMNRFQGNGR